MDASPQSDQDMTLARKPRFYLHRSLIFWVLLLVLIVLFGLFRRHDVSQQSKNLGKQQTHVVVASAHTADVPVYITALGNVTPTYSITVRTQINGQLLRVLFQEGQWVKAGDLLAEIDPRPYQALLLEYQGQLIRDRALLANALIDLNRYQKLWKQDSVSQQILATQQSLVKQYEGAIQIDEGLLAATQLNLLYCRIMSPIDGRIGLRLVDPGNFVQTTDTTGIAVVNMLNPITVVFTIPEDNIPQVMQKIYAGDILSVQAYDRAMNTLLATGKVLTIDNQIDPTTGTVKLKAQFTNDNNQLFPSQFVNVKLLVDTLSQVIVVPTAAIQYGPKGPFVYRVDAAQQVVHANPVTVGVSTQDSITISQGLQVGQLVVTEGADKLTDAASVLIANPSDPSAVNKNNTHWYDWRHYL